MVAVVVAVAVAAYDHVGLDCLDRPCPLQLPAKYPVGPQLAGVLCTHTQSASLPHPQELLPLLAASLPPVLQLVQLMSNSMPPAVLPGHGRSDLQRPEAELQRAPHGLPMSERAPRQPAHALLPRPSMESASKIIASAVEMSTASPVKQVCMHASTIGTSASAIVPVDETLGASVCCNDVHNARAKPVASVSRTACNASVSKTP